MFVVNNNHSILIKSLKAGVDIGNTFWCNMHDETDMIAHYNNDDLRLIAPKYFIEILQLDLAKKYSLPSYDPEGLFKFMGIQMREGYEEKVVLFHVDYPLYKCADMYHEFDLSLFTEQHSNGDK